MARVGDAVTIVHKPNISEKKQYTLGSIDRSHLFLDKDPQRQFPPRIPAALLEPISRKNQDIKFVLAAAVRARNPRRLHEWRIETAAKRQRQMVARGERYAEMRRAAIARGKKAPPKKSPEQRARKSARFRLRMKTDPEFRARRLAARAVRRQRQGAKRKQKRALARAAQQTHEAGKGPGTTKTTKAQAGSQDRKGP